LERLFLEERVHEKRIMDASALVDPASSPLRRSLDGLTSLYLSNALFCVKPANMKTTPTGTLTVVALVGLGIGAVLTFRATAQPTSHTADPDVDRFVLTIKKEKDQYHSLKKNDADGEKAFKKLLCDPNHHFDNTKKLHFKSGLGNQEECDLPDQCAACSRSPSPSSTGLNIKTDKVTVSNAAQLAADDELTAIGSHVTTQVASRSAADIEAVLELLE
jgi:hypothetical protein